MRASPSPRASRGSGSGPVSLGDRAGEDLQFIRRTVERSAAFTGVPGWGGVGMGLVGLATAALAWGQPGGGGWLAVWLLGAAVAISGGIPGEARRSGSVTRASGRHSRQAAGTLILVFASESDTSTWRVTVLPSAPQYWRLRPPRRQWGRGVPAA